MSCSTSGKSTTVSKSSTRFGQKPQWHQVGTRGRSSGRFSPSTSREVDHHAKSIGAISSRSPTQEKAEELLEVASYGHRRFGRPAATFLMAHKEKDWVKDRVIPVAPEESKGGGKHEIANNGHHKARAEEAQNVHPSTIDHQHRGKGKGDKRQRTPCLTKRQPAPKSETSIRTGTSPSGKAARPP